MGARCIHQFQHLAAVDSFEGHAQRNIVKPLAQHMHLFYVRVAVDSGDVRALPPPQSQYYVSHYGILCCLVFFKVMRMMSPTCLIVKASQMAH